MRLLTKSEIIRINHTQVKQYGGNFVPPHNFLHEENLDYVIEAVQMEMFGEPLYPTVHQKAGLYMFSIIANHIFQDGNKRTGLQAAMIFLLLNGYRLLPDDNTLIQFTLSVASGKQSVEAVQAWFEKHIEPI
jgi:death on curing protein